MALSLDGLRLLDAIARTGSFAAAARETDRVPSALTYVVRKLEDDLDVLLFDRSGHRAQLTAAGAELLQEGRHLLRAADDLERRVRRLANGWEVELRIAVDGILRFDAMQDLIRDFYREEPATRLRFSKEVLSGTWDALVSGRADLAIGTPSPESAGLSPSGFQTRPLGELEMVFVVSPDHPLASHPEPIAVEVIRLHRAVAVADTSRSLAALTVGLLRGQDVLTVPTMQDKVLAQIAGLGCGHIPLGYALPHLEAGRLVAKLSTVPRFSGWIHYSWNPQSQGRAMQWFLERLGDAATRRAFLP